MVNERKTDKANDEIGAPVHAQSKGLTYYVDKDGVVSLRPTKEIEFPVLPIGRVTSPSLDIDESTVIREPEGLELKELRTYAERGKNIVSSTRRIRNAVWKVLLDIELPRPGLIPLHEDIYTGWFTIRGKYGITTQVMPYSNEPTEDNLVKILRGRFFTFSPEEFTYWNSVMERRPLTRQEGEILKRPMPNSQWWRTIRGYPMGMYLADATDFLRDFWSKAENLRKERKRTSLAEHIRDHLMTLDIMCTMGDILDSYNARMLGEHMKRNNIGLLEFGPESYVVLYLYNNEELRSRRLRMTIDQSLYFVRDLKTGEKPFTESELKELVMQHGLSRRGNYFRDSI